MANRLSVLKKAQFMAITLGTLVLTAQASIAGETKGTISYQSPIPPTSTT